MYVQITGVQLSELRGLATDKAIGHHYEESTDTLTFKFPDNQTAATYLASLTGYPIDRAEMLSTFAKLSGDHSACYMCHKPPVIAQPPSVRKLSKEEMAAHEAKVASASI